MKRGHLMGKTSALALAAILAAFAAGCQKSAPGGNVDVAATGNVDMAAAPVATLPLSDSPAPAVAPAPPLAALPSHSVQRVAVARPQDAYAFADRANQVSQGFGDAPPDYAFDYQGVRPWSWRGDNGYQTVVEPLQGGGERYYYYQPGSAAPFFVRDPDYAYGYQGGALVVVYDRFGRPLPRADEDRRADDAGRYLWRAQSLYQAAQRQQHLAVARANWEARRAEIDRQQAAWLAARDRNQDWRAYHDQYGQQDQAAWAGERARREAEAARVDQGNPAQAARDRQAALAAAGVGGVAGAAWLAGHHAPGGLTPARQGAVDQRQAFAARQAQAQALAARQQSQLAARQAIADRAVAQRARIEAHQQDVAARAQAAQKAQADRRAQAATRAQDAQKAQAAARTQAAQNVQADRQAQAGARAQAARKAHADRQAQAAARTEAAHKAQADRQAQATADRAAAQAKRQENVAKIRAARETAAANKRAAQPTNTAH